jgi:hypothetical protein
MFSTVYWDATFPKASTWYCWWHTLSSKSLRHSACYLAFIMGWVRHLEPGYSMVSSIFSSLRFNVLNFFTAITLYVHMTQLKYSHNHIQRWKAEWRMWNYINVSSFRDKRLTEDLPIQPELGHLNQFLSQERLGRKAAKPFSLFSK